jgi:hypothetical protein
MGVMTSFFEDLHRDSRGRLNRILVVADCGVASEALLRMLGTYYIEAQQRNTERGPPHIMILDTSGQDESRLHGVEIWMQRTSLGLDNSMKRVGLQFEKGRVLEIPLDSVSNIPLDAVLKCFAADSRREASSILWSKIISIYAKQGNYEIVLWNDTATKIASKVLALTSQGRGFTLPWECGSLVKMPNGNLLTQLKQVYTLPDH